MVEISLALALSLYSAVDVDAYADADADADAGVRADGWKALDAPNVTNISDVMPIFIM